MGSENYITAGRHKIKRRSQFADCCGPKGPETPKLVKSRRTNLVLRASELRFMSAHFDCHTMVWDLMGLYRMLGWYIVVYIHPHCNNYSAR